MAQTPESITVDVRTIPQIRELLADVWDEARWASYDGQGGYVFVVDNPYRTVEYDAD